MRTEIGNKQGFISGTLIILILVAAGISMSILSMLKYATERSLYDLNNIKSELIFENVILSYKVNGVNKTDTNLLLPEDFDITSYIANSDGVTGYQFSLKYKKDIKGTIWIRERE